MLSYMAGPGRLPSSWQRDRTRCDLHSSPYNRLLARTDRCYLLCIVRTLWILDTKEALPVSKSTEIGLSQSQCSDKVDSDSTSETDRGRPNADVSLPQFAFIISQCVCPGGPFCKARCVARMNTPCVSFERSKAPLNLPLHRGFMTLDECRVHYAIVVR